MYTRGVTAVARERFDRDVHGPLDDARNNDLGLVDRVRALWQLEGVGARDVAHDGRRLIEHVGALLAHPDTMLAREAYELLCHLVRDNQRPAEIDVGVGARDGVFVVSPRPFSTCERVATHTAWCPDVDAEVVPLIDVKRLHKKLSAPLALWADTWKATTLVVITATRLRRIRRAGRLGPEPNAPHASAAGDAFTVRATGKPFLLGEVRMSEATVVVHHDLGWDDVKADVVVAPCCSDKARVLVEVLGGTFDAVAVGDAWFSDLRHARGHIAITPDPRRALVVDTTAQAPHVALLTPGEATTFGAYDAHFLEHGGVLRITSQTSTGPDRSRPAVKQQVSAKKQAA